MDRIDMHATSDGVTRVKAWASGNPSAHNYRRVEIGTLRSGSWYCWATKRGKAYVAVTERAACELAERLMKTGEWTPTPARYGPDGLPSDGGTWWQAGGQWFPGEKPLG